MYFVTEKSESHGTQLSCDEARAFWVHWAAGEVMVGRGAVVRQDLMMDWLDDQPLRIQGIAFSTANNVQGDWYISNPRGEPSTACATSNI